MYYRKINLPNSYRLLEKNGQIYLQHFNGTNIVTLSKFKDGFECNLERVTNILDIDRITAILEKAQYEDHKIINA